MREGLEALRSYHVDYDEKNKTPRKTPAHTWASHAADSFGEMALQIREPYRGPRQLFADSAYDVFNLPRNDQEWARQQNFSPNPVPNLEWRPDQPRSVVTDWNPFDLDDTDYR